MLTVSDLMTAMEKSGRRLTARTARNWWSEGVLPPPKRKGRGQGNGTISFWRDRRILLQAQIAYDLLGKRVSLQNTASDLWLVGFSVPFEVVRKAFVEQAANHYQRAGGRSRDMESGLWESIGRFVRRDALIRKGSPTDDEGKALYDLTGGLLELLLGVGDGVPQPGDVQQWATDEATELLSHIEMLAPLRQTNGLNTLPAVRAETAEEVVTWIGETASLQRQQNAIINAMPHDWTRARRITRIAFGLLDRADAAASPKLHTANRALFTALVIGWARLLFPVLLAAVRNSAQRRSVTGMIFRMSAIVRRKQLG